MGSPGAAGGYCLNSAGPEGWGEIIQAATQLAKAYSPSPTSLEGNFLGGAGCDWALRSVGKEWSKEAVNKWQEQGWRRHGTSPGPFPVPEGDPHCTVSAPPHFTHCCITCLFSFSLP